MSQTESVQKEFISVAEYMQLFDIIRATAQRSLKFDEVSFSKIGEKITTPTSVFREEFGLGYIKSIKMFCKVKLDGQC